MIPLAAGWVFRSASARVWVGLVLGVFASGGASADEYSWQENPYNVFWPVWASDHLRQLEPVNGTPAYADFVSVWNVDRNPCNAYPSANVDQLAADKAIRVEPLFVGKNNQGPFQRLGGTNLQVTQPGDWVQYYGDRYGVDNRDLLDPDVANGVLVDQMQIYQWQVNPRSMWQDSGDYIEKFQEAPCDPVGFSRDPINEMNNGQGPSITGSWFVATQVSSAAGLVGWQHGADDEEACNLKQDFSNYSMWLACTMRSEERQNETADTKAAREAVQAFLNNWCVQPDGSVMSHCIHGGKSLDVPNEILDCRGSKGAALSACFMPSVGVVSISDEELQPVNLYCSATVISQNAVLTAAHCVCRRPQAIALGTETGGFLSQYIKAPNGAYLYTSSGGTGQTSTLFMIDDVKTIGGPEQLKQDCEVMEREGRFPTMRDLAVVRVAIPSAFVAKVTQANIVPRPAQRAVINLAGFGPDEADREARKETRRVISSNFIREAEGIAYVQDLHSETGDNDSCATDSGSGAYLRLKDGTLGVFAVLSSGARLCGAHESQYVDLASADARALLASVEGVTILESYSVVENMSDCIGTRC